MKIYVMRHGLTDWNLNNKMQGQKIRSLMKLEYNKQKMPGKNLIEEDLLYNYNLNINDKNVEPVVDLCDRISKLLNYIKDNLNDKKILLVTHCGTTRAIEAYFYGISEDGQLPPGNLKNCEFREYTF